MVCHHQHRRLQLLALGCNVQHDVGDVVVRIEEVVAHKRQGEVPSVVLNINLQ